MKKLFYATGTSLLLSVAFYSCQTGTATATEKGKTFIDTSTMDKAVKPSDNFFEYVNGEWDKRTNILTSDTHSGARLES